MEDLPALSLLHPDQRQGEIKKGLIAQAF